MITPAWRKDHCTSPEQSKDVGPAAPQMYGMPRRLSAANWWNADDDSNLTRMLNKGMLKNPDGSPMKKEDFRIILKSELIINSPTAMLSSLPPDLKSAISTAFLEAATN